MMRKLIGVATVAGMVVAFNLAATGAAVAADYSYSCVVPKQGAQRCGSFEVRD